MLLFLIPSGLAVASWNDVPGNRLYGVKIAMENTVLALAPTSQAKGELQIAFTNQRFSEATTLLNNSASPDGLAYFTEQAEAAKLAIAQAPPGPSRDQMTIQYVTALQNASSQLEQQKQIFNKYNGASVSSGSINTAPSVVHREVIIVNHVTQVTQVVEVIHQIDTTQNQITTIIHDVQLLNTYQPANSEQQNTVTPTPAPTPQPTFTPTPSPSPAPAFQESSLQTTNSPTPTSTPGGHQNNYWNGNNNGNSNGYGNNGYGSGFGKGHGN